MTETSRAVATSHYHGLDNLRAMAILLVLLFHCTPGDDPNRGLVSIPAKLSLVGWAGVDLFFLLSGFLVTKFLITRPISIDSILHFYRNRLLRILPAYFLGLFIVFIIVPILLDEPFTPLKVVSKYLLFVNNYDRELAHSYYSINASTGHFWSLAVEMHFYLLLPFVLFLTKKKHHENTLLGLVLALVGLKVLSIWNDVDAIFIYGATHFKLEGLLLGSLVAINRRNIFLKSKLFVVLTLASLIYLARVVWFSEGSQIFKNGEDFYWLRSTLPLALNIFFTSLLLLATSSRTNILTKKFTPLAYLAKYSYGIYVFHFIYHELLREKAMPIINAFIADENSAALAYFSLQLALSTLLAMASYHLIEKYFLSKKRTVQTNRLNTNR